MYKFSPNSTRSLYNSEYNGIESIRQSDTSDYGRIQESKYSERHYSWYGLPILVVSTFNYPTFPNLYPPIGGIQWLSGYLGIGTQGFTNIPYTITRTGTLNWISHINSLTNSGYVDPITGNWNLY